DLLGPRGAEIACGHDAITVNVLTKFPFKGHLYVQGHLGDPDCTVTADGKTKELSLKIPLMKCGVQQQFLVKEKKNVIFLFNFKTNFRNFISILVECYSSLR